MKCVFCATAVCDGSVRGPMIFVNSAIEPGQPCVMMIGSAFSSGDRW